MELSTFLLLLSLLPLIVSVRVSTLDVVMTIPLDGREGEKWSTLIGILCSIIGNIFISFALNIQRYAHLRHSAKSSQADADLNQPPSPPFRSWHWWLGITLMTIGECGNFIAYGFAPASIISPLGVVTIISNCVIAPVLLKETFRVRDGMGVLLAIAGVITLVLSSSSQESKLSPGDILTAISRTAFVVYFAVTLGLIVVLVYLSQRYGARTPLIDLLLTALFGGYTALSTKGISSLLAYTFYRIFTFPIAYALLFILITTAVLQIIYLNRALGRFSATLVIPIQFVLFTLSVITGSAILYRDFERATRDQMLKFFFGCVMTFSGVYLITSKREGSVRLLVIPTSNPATERTPLVSSNMHVPSSSVIGYRIHSAMDAALRRRGSLVAKAKQADMDGIKKILSDEDQHAHVEEVLLPSDQEASSSSEHGHVL